MVSDGHRPPGGAPRRYQAPNKRVKLPAPLGGRIAFVRQRSFMSSSVVEAPGWTGRRSLRAFR